MTSKRQKSLFDDAGGRDLVHSGQRPARSPEQRSFDRLVGQLERARADLQQWEAETPRLLGRVHQELLPAQRELAQAQRALVEYLDGFLAAPPKGTRLGKRQRAALVDLLCELATSLLAQGPDAQLEAIYDRHSAVPYRQAQAEEEAIELELAEQMLGSFFGDEMLEGHTAHSAEELLHHVQARMQEQAEQQAAAREARAARRRQRRGPDPRAEQRAQEAQAASQSVRDIYRKLASSLHPDREPDPEQRAHKTRLMQQLNQAYQKNDLLGLLRMQLELEHIDAHALAELPAERLRHYNRVLKEQLAALQAETRDRVGRLLISLDLDPFLAVRTPHMVDRLLDERLHELHAVLVNVGQTAEELADPQRRRQQIDAIVQAMKARAAADDLDSLFDPAGW
ncbi:J domain-containing protein [Immundisolibacter sp.]|uniref:J domain-containing protein n=1 Tax=Immundisolibacter sp. TaxID=1934948 RepID=UPI00260CE41C|nr:J domain-containing protein [Immundisolibacter sp.]MDD3652121.1 J domain-containing protein [Immundisolibacter sp.]